MTHVDSYDEDPIYVTARSVPELARIHQAVAQMIYDTLRIGDLHAFHQLAAFLHRMLASGECCGLALSLLLACKEEGGEAVVKVVFPHLLGAGFPPVPFLDDDLDRDAALWAEAATVRELRAYLVAAYRQLSPASQSAVLAHLEKEAA